VFWAWLACLAALLAAVPLAKTPLPRAPGFIAVYEAMLIVIEFITAVLLVGQLMMLRSSALLVLAAGYLGRIDGMREVRRLIRICRGAWWLLNDPALFRVTAGFRRETRVSR